jgi:hypothetical protein
MSLAVFDITKVVENGITIEPVHENTTGTIRWVNREFTLATQDELTT